MKLKYAVVSSNSNPEYLDFWPYVAKAWRRIGIDPLLLYIDKNPPPTSIKNYGNFVYLESVPDWDIIQQAQCIRFWGAKILDAPFIISDMDMLPISEEYYQKGVSNLSDKGITSYSSDIIKYRWYKTNPQYPMCYLAGDPQSFIEILDLAENSHKEFLYRLKSLNIRWGTDQKFFYNQSVRKNYPLHHLERGWIEEKYAKGRLDKAIWPQTDYNIEEYIDCHLPRPLANNLGICSRLFQKLELNM